MIRRHLRTADRSGAATVEMAMVSMVFLLFLFGLIEYSRLIWIRQMAENGVREGARYAVVHAGDATVVTDTRNLVTSRMVGVHNMLKNFNATTDITVFQANQAGADIGSPQNTPFGGWIAVKLDGKFQPVLPNFLLMGNDVPVVVQSQMLSELN